MRECSSGRRSESTLAGHAPKIVEAPPGHQHDGNATPRRVRDGVEHRAVHSIAACDRAVVIQCQDGEFTASPVGGKLQLQILAHQNGSRVEHLLLSLRMQRQRLHELAHLRMAFRSGGASEFV